MECGDDDPMSTCERCGRTNLTGSTGNAKARLLRRASSGVCADCAATLFLKNGPASDVLQVLIATTKQNNLPHPLLMPHVQAQFGRLLTAGFADARPEELDWQRIVENWDLDEVTGR